MGTARINHVGTGLSAAWADHFTARIRRWPSIAHTCRIDLDVHRPAFFYLELLLPIFLSL